MSSIGIYRGKLKVFRQVHTKLVLTLHGYENKFRVEVFFGLSSIISCDEQMEKLAINTHYNLYF